MTQESDSAAPLEGQQDVDSDLNEKIVRQIEYYFGDNNLPRDKFIKEECSKNEGWMLIKTLMTFNRMKTLMKSVPEEGQIARIAEAMKGSELVNVDEATLKIRRNPDIPIPDGTSENRAVYLKGFNKTETKLDDLLEFFNKFEGVEAVIMRYYKEKTIETEEQKSEGANGSTPKAVPKVVWVRKFKGSIFVVFKTPEQAKKLLAEEINFMGNVIAIKMLHTDYRKQKSDEYKERMEKVKNRGKKESDKADNDEADGEGGNEKPSEDFVKGALLRVKNIPAEYSREDFKAKWYAVCNESDFKIVFADFGKQDVEGVIRLEKEGSAAEALKLIPDGKLKIDDEKSMDIAILTEEEENAYLEEITKKRLDRKRRPNTFGGRGRGGRGGGRGGRGGKRRRNF